MNTLSQFSNPLNGLIYGLVVLTIAVEVIRAVMIGQINRLNVVPRISHTPGVLGMTRKIAELHKSFFPASRKATLLISLRFTQLSVFVLALAVMIVGFSKK